LFLEDGGGPSSHRKQHVVTAKQYTGEREREILGLSMVNIQPSLLPWPHLKPVSLPEAEEPAVPLSYSDLHKIPEFQDKGADTRLYPSLQNQCIPGRASDHHPAIHISIPLADK
jgi:hypothetical protein